MGSKRQTDDVAAVDEASAIQDGARRLGVATDVAMAQVLVDLLDRVYLWNTRIRLTAVKRSDAVRLHILDSLALVPVLPYARRLADLGTGAGFPGIVLAAALPELDVTLVETKRKRCAYLTETVGSLGLTNVSVVESDATRLPDRFASYFDAVTSRAFLPPARFVEVATRLMSPDGIGVLMMGGRSSFPELPSSVEPVYDRGFVLPGGKDERRVIGFRCRSTPAE